MYERKKEREKRNWNFCQINIISKWITKWHILLSLPLLKLKNDIQCAHTQQFKNKDIHRKKESKSVHFGSRRLNDCVLCVYIGCTAWRFCFSIEFCTSENIFNCDLNRIAKVFHKIESFSLSFLPLLRISLQMNLCSIYTNNNILFGIVVKLAYMRSIWLCTSCVHCTG